MDEQTRVSFKHWLNIEFLPLQAHWLTEKELSFVETIFRAGYRNGAIDTRREVAKATEVSGK